MGFLFSLPTAACPRTFPISTPEACNCLATIGFSSRYFWKRSIRVGSGLGSTLAKSGAATSKVTSPNPSPAVRIPSELIVTGEFTASIAAAEVSAASAAPSAPSLNILPTPSAPL